jgi:hypothetical protein
MVQRIEDAGAKVVMVMVHDPEAYGGTPPLKRSVLINDLVRDMARRHRAALVPFHKVLLKAGGTVRCWSNRT